MSIEIIGIYPIAASEPCHLIEVYIRNSEGNFDFGEITQEQPSQPKFNGQVPWDERQLTEDGAACKTLNLRDSSRDFRAAFFFHFLDFTRPLLTPEGPVMPISESPLPDRLTFFCYKPP